MGLFEGFLRALSLFSRSDLLDRPAAETSSRLFWAVNDVLAGRPGPTCVPWKVGDLIDDGIGGVVSLDGPIRTSDLKKAGIRHLPVYQPMLSLQTAEEQERFLKVMPQVIGFIDDVRSQGRATLVHCFYGCDRTGAAIACYLVAREGYTADQGIAIVQRLNPDAMQMVGYKEVVHMFAANWDHTSERD